MVASKSSSSHKRQLPSKARGATALNPKGKPLAISTRGLTSPPGPNGKAVPILPSSESAPLWLLRLCTWNRQSSIVTLLLVVATLTVYAWTVYSQQTWSQEYHRLVSLQRDERQLATTNEVLKNKMALQAEEQVTGLVPPNPATTIFLTPAQERPAAAADSVVANTEPSRRTHQLQKLPLGY